MGKKKIMAKTKTSEISCGEPREIKNLKPRVGGEMAMCHAGKLAGKERRKVRQAFFRVVRWRERKSEAEISDRGVEEKNPVDVVRLSAILLPEILTRLGTQGNRTVLKETPS